MLPFLRIPPFPGAKPVDLMRAADQQDGRPADVEQIIAALRRNRVGGHYWGEQPELPNRYILVRSATLSAAESPEMSAGSDPLVLWTEDGRSGSQDHARLVVRGSFDPWHMVAGATEVLVDAQNEVALVAALAGVPVRCFGTGRFDVLSTGGTSSLYKAIENEFTRLDLRNPFTGVSMSAEEAISLCGFWRLLIDSNRNIGAVFGCASWKRATIEPLLWRGSGRLRFESKATAVERGSEVAIWRSRTAAATLRKLQDGGSHLLEVEDGFIRSSGLGADCVPPLSIVVDRSGIYFDPSGQSDLEASLQDGDFGPELVARARQLREIILSAGITKYSSGQTTVSRCPGDQRQILVAGQVEDDRAVLSGLGPATNLELLRQVRDDAPDAHIIYKPHPDVEAGHRVGKIEDRVCLELADSIIRDAPISAVIAAVDEVHVNTSLAGFEALLREKPVVTYGVPFYAGWGLTCDKGPVPKRRSARRTLDELVAAALLVYPRYLDPLTGLPCPPEVLVSRLSANAPDRPGLLVRLRRLQGALRRRLPSRRR
jgi:capsular polysaccharide export protein